MREQGQELTLAQIQMLARALGTRARDRSDRNQQRLHSERAGLSRQAARPTELEWVGRESGAASLPAGSDGATVGQRRSTLEAEMGVRVPGRES